MSKKTKKQSKKTEIRNKKQYTKKIQEKQEAYNTGKLNKNNRLKRIIRPFAVKQGIKYSDAIVLDLPAIAKRIDKEYAEFETLSSARRKEIVTEEIPEVSQLKNGKTLLFHFSRSVDIKSNTKDIAIQQIAGNLKTYVKYVLHADKYKSKRPMCEEHRIYCQYITD